MRISNVAIALQLGLFLTWVVLLAAAPQRQNWREPQGVTCPVLTGTYGDVLVGFVIASVPVGVVALVASVVSAVLRTSEFRAFRMFLALLAAALVPLMAFLTLLSALCGSS